ADLLDTLRQHSRNQHPAPTQRTEGAPFSLVDFVRAAPEGERNSRLFWAACRVAERGLALADAEALLLPAALAAGLSEREARATIRSAYKQPVRKAARGERHSSAPFRVLTGDELRKRW
ncbi:MAG: primase C-terminal domain-containing protein, partial [Thermoflexales bacterium]|nr:primase C-terminal domain-containing protein [Thermoflexales bacterium]